MTIGYNSVWNEIPRAERKLPAGNPNKEFIGALTKNVKAFDFFLRLT